MKEILLSEPAIVLYVSIVLFVWRYLKIKFDWDTERWEGLIASAFNYAEKEGVAKGLTGNDKLSLALNEFIKQYQEVWDSKPTPKDLTDAALDLGRLALEHKLRR